MEIFFERSAKVFSQREAINDGPVHPKIFFFKFMFMDGNGGKLIFG
jgi:hypothetical protein